MAWNLRSKIVEGNRGFVQHPALRIGWGGGYWYGLARQLVELRPREHPVRSVSRQPGLPNAHVRQWPAVSATEFHEIMRGNSAAVLGIS